MVGVKYPVPFYSNTPDDARCVPAVFRMIIKYFLPQKEFSWEELDKLLKHTPGKGTWWNPGLVKLVNMGFEVKYIDPFDWWEFYKRGKEYVHEAFPQHQAEWYLKNSNILTVREDIPEFLEKVDWENRSTNLNELEKFIEDGWLVGVDVNSRALSKKPGYVSHMVVVYGFDKDNLYLHDPGLPPMPSRKVSKRVFLYAWGDYTALVAIRYKKSPSIKKVEDLRVFNTSMRLLPRLYDVAYSIPHLKLRTQLTNSGEAIAPLIAEGFAKRRNPKQAAHFYEMAMAESDEVVVHLQKAIILAGRFKKISIKECKDLIKEYTSLSKQLNKLSGAWRRLSPKS